MSEPTILYDFDPRNLPPEYLQAIGLVVTASSQTESILQDFIGALLGIDNVQATALTAHMSFPLKDDVIRTIVELDAPHVSEVDVIDDLLDAVKIALDKRNLVVHNRLYRNPENNEIFSMRQTARGSFQATLKKISVEEIKQDAALIYQVGMDVMSFMLSRNLSPYMRTKPLRVPINRGKKARAQRRSIVTRS